METKEFKIQVPEGYEIDKENSTFECIKFKPIKKKLTYEDVARVLFEDKEICYINAVGYLTKGKVEEYVLDPNICTSKKQAEKLIAINKLMNVAKYLNMRSKPNNGNRYYFSINGGKLTISFADMEFFDLGAIYFNTKEDSEKAEEILGEETIKTALSTDW